MGRAQLSNGYCELLKYTANVWQSLESIEEKTVCRSGDLARWLLHREIKHFGRKDQPIKINSFRVKIEEVTERLRHF